MGKVTVVFGVVAAILSASAFLTYFLQIRTGQSKPNPASWSIWAFLAIINAFSYQAMTRDTIATLQFFTGSLGCVSIFVYALYTGKFAGLKLKEWMMLIIGLVAILVWWFFRSATGANLIVLFAMTVSFVPTIEDVWRDPSKEKSKAWVFWATAFSLTAINVVLRGGHPVALVTPVAQCLAHSSVAILSSRSK